MRPNALIAVAAASLTLSGCGVHGTAAEKAGAAHAPVTLRLGTVETAAEPYGDEVEEFAAAVGRLSGGEVTVEVVWEAPGPFTGESEVQLGAMVRDGEIDLAVVPTRAWDQVGVTSMQAMQAPFLVDSVELANAVAGSDVAGEMLDGLADIGVVGLAMWPESLRHPVGFTGDLVTAADFQGARLRVPPSDASYRLIRALGAQPVEPADWDAAFADGTLDGAESAFVWSGGLPALGSFTANVTFYPKVNTIVANADVFGSLAGSAQAALRDAAADALAYVVETNPTEADLAVAYCDSGGSVVLAADADVAELEAEVEPVFAELSADAGTARLIDEIRAVGADVTLDPSAAPAACQPEPRDTTAASSEVQVEFPEGVYRAELVLPQILGTDDPVLTTLTFEDGQWQSEDVGALCTGTYVTESGRVWVTLVSSCGGSGPLFDAQWALDGDELRFLDVHGSDPNVPLIFGDRVWTKIE